MGEFDIEDKSASDRHVGITGKIKIELKRIAKTAKKRFKEGKFYV